MPSLLPHTRYPYHRAPHTTAVTLVAVNARLFKDDSINQLILLHSKSLRTRFQSNSQVVLNTVHPSLRLIAVLKVQGNYSTLDEPAVPVIEHDGQC